MKIKVRKNFFFFFFYLIYYMIWNEVLHLINDLYCKLMSKLCQGRVKIHSKHLNLNFLLLLKAIKKFLKKNFKLPWFLFLLWMKHHDDFWTTKKSIFYYFLFCFENKSAYFPFVFRMRLILTRTIKLDLIIKFRFGLVLEKNCVRHYN